LANKNIPRKSVRSHLFLEASVRESYLTMQEKNKPVFSTKFEFDENHIMSRRPTRLSLELMSRVKEKSSLPEAEELSKKEGNS